jgi:hypothetical protein
MSVDNQRKDAYSEEQTQSEDEQPMQKRVKNIGVKDAESSQSKSEMKNLPNRTKRATNDSNDLQLPEEPDEEIEEDQSSYSDVDSQGSTAARRRYQRGGRKNATNRTPKDPNNNLDVEILDYQEKSTKAPQEEDTEACTKCGHLKSGSLPAIGAKRRSKKKRPGLEKSGTDTGVRAFNMKKAQESGGSGGQKGARPFGITLEKLKSTQSATEGATKKRRARADQVEKKSHGEERENWESESEEDEEEPQQQKPEKEERECVSIRLDLNLELEIFLKAKIKGDVTITFL